MMLHESHDHGRHAVHLALVEKLRKQAAEVQRLTAGLEESALATPTVAGKWSLKELVCHLRRMEDVFADRFQRVLTEDNPAITSYHPDGDEEFIELTRRSTATTLGEYLDRREALCRRLEGLSPGEWHRKGRHPDFAQYDVHFQVEYMAHHEAHHIYQIFERRAPLGKLPH